MESVSDPATSRFQLTPLWPSDPQERSPRCHLGLLCTPSSPHPTHHHTWQHTVPTAWNASLSYPPSSLQLYFRNNCNARLYKRNPELWAWSTLLLPYLRAPLSSMLVVFKMPAHTQVLITMHTNHCPLDHLTAASLRSLSRATPHRWWGEASVFNVEKESFPV